MSMVKKGPMKSILLLISPVLLAFAFPLCASASLGGDVKSVQADQAQMRGTLRSTVNAAYTVHEIKASTGVVVREYVSPAGKVFAVAWQGPTHPDLHQLLGTYYETFVQAAEVRKLRAGNGPLLVEQSGLVVQMGGHMRAFTGRAYMSYLLPSGVAVTQIR